MKWEWQNMEQFLEDNIEAPRMFMKSGELEPVHLTAKERNIMVKGMEETMEKAKQEIVKSQMLYKEKTKKRKS